MSLFRNKTGKRRRWWLVPGTILLALPLLFAANGLFLAAREEPLSGAAPPSLTGPPPGPHLTIMAWNIAKCFIHQGGLRFVPAAEARRRLRAMAKVIRRHDPDLLFLAEVVKECTLCPVDQVVELSRETGLAWWAFGENYNFGLPFLRIVGGNAILSRRPFRTLANPDLAGRKPFWVTRNNRRLLLCALPIGPVECLLAAVHTDSFDLANNLRQTEQILRLTAGRQAILAGDFNAGPEDPSLARIAGSDRFTGPATGPPTYPAARPDRRIDYIFAPKGWELVRQEVIDCPLSDHRPVVAVYRLPTR